MVKPRTPKAARPKTKVEREAELVEQVFAALIDETWLETQDRVDQAQSEENVRAYEVHIAFVEALKIYESALANRDLETMVDATVNADLRRHVLSSFIRKPGRVTGSGNPQDQHHASEARKLKDILKRIWPSLKIKGLPPKFSKQRAEEIVEAIYRDHHKQALPIGWSKAH